MAPSVFRYRQYLRQKWRLKIGYFTVSLPFIRVNPPWVLNAQERNLYHMKGLDEQHVMEPLVVRYRQYLRQKWRLKIGHFTVSLPFMRVTPSRVSNAPERNLYHMKALNE